MLLGQEIVVKKTRISGLSGEDDRLNFYLYCLMGLSLGVKNKNSTDR